MVGPTAAGKSALACRLAVELGAEIVNADALQVYRGFDIGTAKPGVAERRAVPHHLIDILDPVERYSAGEFARRAQEAFGSIASRGRRAILVGGSGLYLRALWSGIAPLPEVNPAIRAELEERLVRQGLEELSRELARVDPIAARRLGARDSQRIRRALEVHRATGVPLSEWIARSPFGSSAVAMRKIGLTLPRAVLYDRIDARAREMMSRGWVAEVERLLDSGVSSEAPAFQAIGYSQLVAALEGRVGMDEALEQLIRATRRFAKRQETWFRREAGIEWWDARDVQAGFGAIMKAVLEKNGRGADE